MNKLSAMAFAVTMGVFSHSAIAVSIDCSNAGVGGADVTNFVTANSGCEVGSGNQDFVNGGNGSAATFTVNTDDLFGGASDNWILAEKWDFDTGELDDVRMSVGLGITGGNTGGTWELAAAPADYEFMMVQKGGNGMDQSNYIGWLLDGTSGNYSSVFHKNGDYKTISHLSVYKRANLSPVPLPASFLLMGSALLGLIGYGKRRKTAWPSIEF